MKTCGHAAHYGNYDNDDTDAFAENTYNNVNGEYGIGNECR